jgi:hypothetical protein
MEFSVPYLIDVPRGSASEYNIPMGFRRQPYWFLSFVMTPFKDIDDRAADEPSQRTRARRRGR